MWYLAYLYFKADGKQDDTSGDHLIKSDPSGKSSIFSSCIKKQVTNFFSLVYFYIQKAVYM